MSQATLGSGPYRNSSLFSGYYLDERVADLDDWESDDEAEAAFEALRDLWELEGEYVTTHGEDELIDQWIGEVLDILGFDTISEGTLPGGGGYVDRLLFESRDDRYAAVDRKENDDREGMFSGASALLEAKQWGHDFEKRFSDERPYRDASHQVKYYLERTPPDLKWGILTDGKKWRLYGTKDYETQTYYEVDLPELLESGDLQQFKYFYCFFRPEAFVEVAGSSFLETVWSESETAAQELGEDLQDNVFTALRVLGKGFVENNDLAIDPEDESARAELKEQSLVLLYRLMFVLYAESRGLIDPEEPSANAEYHENFSLEEVRSDIIETVEGGDVESGAVFHDEYSTFSTTIWNRLSRLFELIDEGEEELDIPPYNGGLFDHDDHEFLAENSVSDPAIAEVIFRLSTTQNDEGEHVPADYADLDTRHLGSIYEGLLEHEFRIAPEAGMAAVAEDGGQVWKSGDEVSVADAVEVVDEGGLYVVNDEGERKATGAYYTPDYVVTYIVEETIDPLIDEIHADLEADGLSRSDGEYFRRFYDRVTDLTVLDPAMGSGHFLTKATGYLTEHVMSVVREQEIQSYDEQDIRRTISKEVIYGVDLNGMAVELAKLSMWLETLAADQPLAFLDHHLKDGNSLVGSDITEVLSDDTEDNDGQLTLTQAFARVRQDTLGHVMELMTDLLAYDNDSLESVKSMEELYDEIREDPLYTRLFELANVHTAEEFGCDVPEDAYEQMAGAIEAEDDWATIRGEDWFTAAQATADEQNFFHWELEFPEVFFDRDGGKLAGAGFAAVVGNPPYVKFRNIRDTNLNLVEYAKSRYHTSTGRFDLYALFVERGASLSVQSNLGYILPNRFVESQAGRGIRSFLQRNKNIRKIIDFGQYQVFDSAITYTCLLFLGESNSLNYSEISDQDLTKNSFNNLASSEIPIEELNDGGWVLTGPMERQVMEKMEDRSTILGDVSEYISDGIHSGDNDVMIVEVEQWGDEQHTIYSKITDTQYQVESDIARPIIGGNGIERYGGIETDLAVIYPYQIDSKKTAVIPEPELKEKYPQSYQYLSDFRNRLSSRGSDTMDYNKWYSLWRPREKRLWESEKLFAPKICRKPEFTIDDKGGMYVQDSVYGIVPENNTKHVRSLLMATLNSTPSWFYIYITALVQEGDFRQTSASFLSSIPIPERSPEGEIKPDIFRELVEEYIDTGEKPEVKSPTAFLSYLGRLMLESHHERNELNTNLLDYIQPYSDGSTLTEIGIYQPPEGIRETKLTATKEDYEKIRVGTATCERETKNTVIIYATARYKPEDEDSHETDRWGYTEDEAMPAMRLTDLTEREADLIEHFVPVAVDEAGGFANFRETATKTNSLIDRLKAIEVPDVDDVADDLENYLETKERAEELDAKIEQTDALIDEIVYELYGLTDEEIEIIEEAVGE